MKILHSMKPTIEFLHKTYKLIRLFILSITAGAISWAICPLFTDQFEPFDTEICFFIGQFVLSIFTIYIGYMFNTKILLTSIIGLYFGMNAFAYIFGGSESRLWFPIGLFTSVFLCVMPLLSGLIARTIKYFAYGKKNNDRK